MYNNYNYLTSTAGIKFANDDGTPRQDIIKRLCRNDTKHEYRFLVTLKIVDFENKDTGIREDAIEVWVGKDQIGYIPRKDIRNLLPIAETTAQVVGIAGYYEPAESYTVNLYEHTPPTPKQYSYVKRICMENGWQMPLYTKQDFTRFITEYEKASRGV